MSPKNLLPIHLFLTLYNKKRIIFKDIFIIQKPLLFSVAFAIDT